jgi:hypothetical protein
MLLEEPGWRRVRVFRQIDGKGPAYMAIHELESTSAFEHPQHAAATSTPWRERIRSGVVRRERYLFAPWRPETAT